MLFGALAIKNILYNFANAESSEQVLSMRAQEK